jgi:hypothetical protein
MELNYRESPSYQNLETSFWEDPFIFENRRTAIEAPGCLLNRSSLIGWVKGHPNDLDRLLGLLGIVYDAIEIRYLYCCFWERVSWRN